MDDSRLAKIDLRLLAVFAAVVESGGFTAAQVILNSTQPTISNRMAALEQKLGVRLCERGRTGFRVTPQGRAIYESIKTLFAAHDAFNKQIAALHGVVTGDLHLGVIDNTVTNDGSPLVPALRRFKDRQTSVHVHLHVGSPLETQQKVVDGRLELGIGCFPNRAPGLIYKKLFDERHELYCGAGHPLWEQTALHTPDLLPYEFVHRSYFPMKHPMLPAGARVTATVATMEAVAMLVLTGRYLGYLPTHYARPWLEADRLRQLKIAKLSSHAANFELIYRRGSILSLAAKAFIADLNAR
ncbi:LysR family transcriptional regulator [Bordetella petrii]|uniref:LysR family transcriptional regulator n=1 Tax=Bordetella petrii TaxID=94624 RepID=UPI00047B8945|nr:LysR family transcriptional regulator [Bordetella petrii]